MHVNDCKCMNMWRCTVYVDRFWYVLRNASNIPIPISIWHCSDASVADESRRKSHHRPPDQQAWTWLLLAHQNETYRFRVLRCFLSCLKCELCTKNSVEVYHEHQGTCLTTFCMALLQHLESGWYVWPILAPSPLDCKKLKTPSSPVELSNILRSPFRCWPPFTKQHFIKNPTGPRLLRVFSDVSPFGMRIWRNTFRKGTSEFQTSEMKTRDLRHMIMMICCL